MKSLFNISTEYLSIVSAIIDNDGEATPEQESALQITKEELETKAVNYGFIIKQIEGDIDIITEEIKRLQNLQKVRQNAVDRLKNNLKNAMELFDVTEVKSPVLKVNFRKSESVNIPDLALLDSRFIKIKTVKEADKIAIKEAIKNGETVQGATLEVKNNLQIK